MDINAILTVSLQMGLHSNGLTFKWAYIQMGATIIKFLKKLLNLLSDNFLLFLTTFIEN